MKTAQLKDKQQYIIESLERMGIKVEQNKIDLKKENASVILSRSNKKPIIK